MVTTLLQTIKRKLEQKQPKFDSKILHFIGSVVCGIEFEL